MHMKRLVSATLAIVACGCAGAAQRTVTETASGAAAVETDSVTAPSLGRRVANNVVLPPGYDAAHKYPVLWLLHGYGGHKDDWLKLSDLRDQVARRPFIVVLPSAENSWYVNAQGRSGAAYETFITVDLYDDVARRFSVDTSRQAIAGLSMGGYGAVMLGLRHPQRYRFVGGLSPALSILDELGRNDSVMWNVGGKSMRVAFGPDLAAAAPEYDPLRVVSTAPLATMPYFFLAIGEKDDFRSFLPASRAFADSLRARGVRYEYHELPGGHTWPFWKMELQPMMESAWKVLNADSTRRR